MVLARLFTDYEPGIHDSQVQGRSFVGDLNATLGNSNSILPVLAHSLQGLQLPVMPEMSAARCRSSWIKRPLRALLLVPLFLLGPLSVLAIGKLDLKTHWSQADLVSGGLAPKPLDEPSRKQQLDANEDRDPAKICDDAFRSERL